MTTLLLDLTKLADAFYEAIEYDDSCEYGSIGIDCKRPFGNSDVEVDVLEIIGAQRQGDDGSFSEEQREYAATLYKVRLPQFLRHQWSAMRQSGLCSLPKE